MRYSDIITEAVSKTIFYHGTNSYIGNRKFSEEFDESKFSLLGKGIYFYKDIKASKEYGCYVYKITIPNNINIMPLDFELSDEDLLRIFPSITMPDMAGIYKPLWWATDGWNIIEQNRKQTFERVKLYLIDHYNFDGMYAIYPKGGLVVVVWRNIDKLKPRYVGDAKSK